ncbi:MAG TPA: tRNA lysidine(34) synthetase TilS [Sphingomicrobium sp.]
MVPDATLLDRFRADLDALIAPGERLGIAVSGGPDSLALLVLATAVRPGEIEAATVDHGLRTESRAEAAMVAEVCARLGVPHAILTADWPEPPVSAIQERAREMRYRLLANWLGEQNLAALLTGHHGDDQAETIVMRLNRGSGVRGLAGMRPMARVPGTAFPLLRPLLGWRRGELQQICANAGLSPVDDPSNEDEHYERVRIRRALAGSDLLDSAAAARSARNLAEADEALDWLADSLAPVRVTDDAEALRIDPDGLPREILRRLLRIAFARFHAPEPRGGDLERAIDTLAKGGTTTLSGLRLQGGAEWRLTAAPARRS